MEHVSNALIQILKKVMNNGRTDIDSQTNLIDDLGMDSITLMMFVIEVEETFNIELPNDFFTMDNLSRFNSFVEYIEYLQSDGKEGD